MRKSNSSLPTEGAGAQDIGRLWETIKKDFMEDFRIEIRPFQLADRNTGLVLELLSDGPADSEGRLWICIWSSKTFANPFHLISTGQLFDLLIVGYRCMERYFEGGEAFAPSRRPK